MLYRVLYLEAFSWDGTVTDVVDELEIVPINRATVVKYSDIVVTSQIELIFTSLNEAV